jgi:hypothetical protein
MPQISDVIVIHQTSRWSIAETVQARASQAGSRIRGTSGGADRQGIY